MKKLLTLALPLVALTVFTRLGVAQQPQTGVAPQQIGVAQPITVQLVDTKKLVADAIASSIVKLKGQEFPIVAKGTGSDAAGKGGASCELGETQTFTKNAAIDLESPNHTAKSNTYPSSPPERMIVSPPNADWVIQSYQRHITTAGPPYEAGDSAFPAGYSFLTAGNYSSVKSTMHSFVGSLNVPDYVKVDLNAKLDTFISNISSYSYSLSGSHGTVEHTALVRGVGVINLTTGHSWYHGYIDGTLACAPAYLHDQDALTTRLKTWVNSVVRKLPTIPAGPVGTCTVTCNGISADMKGKCADYADQIKSRKCTCNNVN